MELYSLSKLAFEQVTLFILLGVLIVPCRLCLFLFAGTPSHLVRCKVLNVYPDVYNNIIDKAKRQWHLAFMQHQRAKENEQRYLFEG